MRLGLPELVVFPVERTDPTPFSGIGVVVGYYKTGSSTHASQRPPTPSGTMPATNEEMAKTRQAPPAWATALTVLLALATLLLAGNAIFQQIVNYAYCGGSGVWSQWDLPPPRSGEPPPM